MPDPPIVDMWAPLVPTPECVAHLKDHFAEEMLGYLRVFDRQEATLEGVREMLDDFQMSREAVVNVLDDCGIARSMITGFDESSTIGTTFMSNELVAGLADDYPTRFIPFAGADPHRGMAAVEEIERRVTEDDFQGVSLRPFLTDLPADDRRYYPIYAKCIELDVPVSIHTSANWSETCENDLGHPRHVDRVASDLPELKIIASHGGYPWVREACLMAWKHPNVYLELAAHRPKHMAKSGTGWGPLFQFGTSTIEDKIFFGTGWFLLGQPPSEYIEEFRQLPIDEETHRKWTYQNAVDLMGLEIDEDEPPPTD